MLPDDKDRIFENPPGSFWDYYGNPVIPEEARRILSQQGLPVPSESIDSPSPVPAESPRRGKKVEE